CENKRACVNMAKTLKNAIAQKWNPTSMPERADGLDLNEGQAKANAEVDVSKNPRVFNPDITEKKSPENAIRIFLPNTAKDNCLKKPGKRKARAPNGPMITAYTDGSSINNGTANAKTGAGVWISDNNPLN
ncbi:hypothetical protein BOTBODRAFT_77781, partial [Botryobasidium botryosum FD-172 SS1]